MTLLFRYLKPHRLQVALLWLALLATIATQLINPQLIGRFLDAAATGNTLTVLLGAAGLFLAIALVEQALGLATTYLSTNVGWLATNRLREDLLLHCLRLDRTFHKAHSPGVLIERIDGDVNELGNFFSQLGLNLLNNLLLLLGVLAILWWEAWRIALVITVIAAVGLWAVNALRRAAVPHWQRARQATADLYGFLEERLHGTEDIRANGATAYVMQGLFQVLQVAYTQALRTRVFNVGSLMLPLLVFGLASTAVFLLGERFHRQAGMSIGTIYQIIYYLGLLSTPLWQIVNEVQELQTAGASVERVQALLGIQSALAANGQQTLPAGPLAVNFEGVGVRYAESSELVLQDIHFRLAAGEVLGLLGRTGSGKTTLSRLLLRLVEPTHGWITVGAAGLKLEDLSLSALRQRVGMVTQEVELFQATIRDNLTFFDPTVSDATLLTMIHHLGLDEWLASLPAGLDTPLGAGGQGLSAGQAQLVAFLRIGLQDPGLVILDEPSSRLDPLTERLLDRAIGRLLQKRTGIIIAHRLETVQRVDKILILANGRMVEFGERAALMTQAGSHFAGLLAQK